eukprot:964510-Rhodomonas_salina.1
MFTTRAHVFTSQSVAVGRMGIGRWCRLELPSASIHVVSASSSLCRKRITAFSPFATTSLGGRSSGLPSTRRKESAGLHREDGRLAS